MKLSSFSPNNRHLLSVGNFSEQKTIVSNHILFQCNHISSHPVSFCSSHPFPPYRPVLSNPVPADPILSHQISTRPSLPLQSRPIPSHPIPSHFNRSVTSHSHPILLTYFFIFHSVASLRSVAAEFLSWIDRYRLTSVLSTPCLYFQSTGNPSSLLTALVT